MKQGFPFILPGGGGTVPPLWGGTRGGGTVPPLWGGLKEGGGQSPEGGGMARELIATN